MHTFLLKVASCALIVTMYASATFSQSPEAPEPIDPRASSPPKESYVLLANGKTHCVSRHREERNIQEMRCELALIHQKLSGEIHLIKLNKRQTQEEKKQKRLVDVNDVLKNPRRHKKNMTSWKLSDVFPGVGQIDSLSALFKEEAGQDAILLKIQSGENHFENFIYY